MTYAAKLMCGIIVLTIPTIEYGGYFLLSLLSGKQTELALTDFQQAMFRAGHAHAGVIVLLSLIVQLMADHVFLPSTLTWIVRIGVPLAAILISGGFFGSAIGREIIRPGKLIVLLYIGIFVLALCLIILGIGLLRAKG